MGAMKKRFTIGIFFIVLAAYTLIFPHFIRKELVFLPSWATVIPDEHTAAPAAAGDPVPFKLSGKFGYIGPSGIIVYSDSFLSDAAVAEDFFINYSNVSERLVMQDKNGRILNSIDTEGYPFFLNERFYVISADRMTVSEYDEEGEVLWTVSPGAMITCADASSKYTLLGLLNGDVLLFDHDGTQLFSFFSTESRYSAVYGCSITGDGSSFAVVSGLNHQKLIVFQKRNEKYSRIFTSDTAEQVRRNLYLDFSRDGKYLYMETSEGLAYYHTVKFEDGMKPLEGRIVYSSIAAEKSLSFVVTHEGSKALLNVYRNDIGSLADFSFPYEDFFFYPADGCIYVGSGDTLVRIDIIEG